jgi:hypothetical protein
VVVDDMKKTGLIEKAFGPEECAAGWSAEETTLVCRMLTYGHKHWLKTGFRPAK